MKPTTATQGIPLSKGFSVFLCFLLSAAVIAVPLLLFVLPSSDYSEDENRMLATAPSFSVDALFEGEYTKGCRHISATAFLSEARFSKPKPPPNMPL